MNSKLEDLLNSLESLAGRHANEPETVVMIETVAKALHFIQHIGRANDFWEYARVFNTEEAWPKPLRSFASREEALAWLQTQPTLPYEVVLEVAGTLHNVGRMPKGDWVLIRFPSLKELESEE
ncbi:hypothetical protein [Cystobacter fuscus]|uniref:hypothetical protein n=1 Tax=Cystobacter fuscus TaxID=43 RepID=UPI0005BCBAE4|nr:hypothetical protein [Cystobacter fuscus]